jgi:MFS family permease
LSAQTLLGRDDQGSVELLLRFLIALPLGAVLGGALAGRLGDRWVAFSGLIVAAGGYLLISRWPIDVLAARHELGPLSLPALDTDLALAGLGLGLVIAPLSAAVLRAVPPEQHGVASAFVVVARMTGMLLGIAALSAWGLHRFQSLTSDLYAPLRILLPSQEAYDQALSAYTDAVRGALLTEYSEIFVLTSVICVVGALLSLVIGARAKVS